ncbi:uncharacterized protein JCM6883_001301 [Sporobolomyces salmoneus]|uniref:uncharacterized protein n=1 Tax=Sporobolomyces salmoneus TaxID=183962 RepID=UPI0031766D30
MQGEPRPPSSIRPISLEELCRLDDGSSLNSSLIYRGKIDRIIRYNPVSLSFNLVDYDSAPEQQEEKVVEVKVLKKGEWMPGFDQKLKEGNGILLKGKGGRLVKEGTETTVVYEKEISGYFLPEEEPFSFVKDSASKSQKSTLAKGRSNSKSFSTTSMKDKYVQTNPGRFIPDSPENQGQPKAGSSKKRSIGNSADGTSSQVSNKKRKEGEDDGELNLNLRVAKNVSYSPLADLNKTSTSKKHFAVVIVSAQIFEPREGKKEYFVRLKVTDPSLYETEEDGGGEIPTIELDWYNSSLKEIPKFAAKDVLFQRGLYIPTGGKPKIQWSSRFRTPYLVLKSSELLDSTIHASHHGKPFKDSNNTVLLSEQEIKHAAKLARFYQKMKFPEMEPLDSQAASATSNAQASSSSSSTLARRKPTKLREIKDIEPDKFCDIYAEILKCYVPSSAPVSLYVTDYTSNSLLMNYSSSSSSVQQGIFPLGQQTLQVSLFDSQYKPLSHLTEQQLRGNFVKLDNLRPKLNLEGDLLECTLVDDQRFKDKKYVKLIKRDGYYPDEVKTLLQRKRAQQKK